MKHTKSLLILLCTLTATLCAGSSVRAQCADTESGFAGGDGSCAKPFQICNANQLNLMRLRANAHYVLIDDIDLSNGEGAGCHWTAWPPVHRAQGKLNFTG